VNASTDKARRARKTAKPAAAPASAFDLSPTLPPRDVFLSRVRRAAIYALALIVLTLAVGMVGYHELEDISWLDSFHQSALLLSGMGPVVEIETVAGKLFDGIYALFCGVVLLASTGLLFAPVLHRILHRFHIEDSRDR
jgi:hypothetical protein